MEALFGIDMFEYSKWSRNLENLGIVTTTRTWEKRYPEYRITRVVSTYQFELTQSVLSLQRIQVNTLII